MSGKAAIFCVYHSLPVAQLTGNHCATFSLLQNLGQFLLPPHPPLNHQRVKTRQILDLENKPKPTIMFANMVNRQHHDNNSLVLQVCAC